jgi:peptide/nickel transport system permease protein
VARIVLRRAFVLLFVLLGVSFVTFFLARVAPGDPARMIAGPHADAAAIANIRALYGLDRALPEQYLRYLAGLLHGDFGTSFLTHRPVADDLRDFMPATLELAAFALLMGSTTGLLLGVAAALMHGTPGDGLARLIAIAGLSFPAFWLAMVFQLVIGVQLGWLPLGGRLDPTLSPPPAVTGFLTVDSLLSLRLDLFADALRHLFLPALTLALAEVGLMTRIVRSSMLEVLGEDYIRTAEAKGLANLRIVSRHELRNALLPAVTVLGLEIGMLAGGVFLVETIFAWPGIGRYIFDAIRASDYNAIMGVTVLVAIGYVVVNLLVDLAYVYLDPRIRYT